MSTPQDTSSRPVPISQSPDTRGRSPSGSLPRTALTARLASPVASGHLSGTPRIRQIPTPAHGDGGAYGSVTPLAGATNTSSLPGPGISALAAALSNSIGTSPPRFGTPPLRPLSPAAAGAQAQGTGLHSNYGSFDNRPRSVQGSHGLGGPVAYEDPEIVKRHLVQPSEASQVYDGSQEGPFAGSSMSPRGASPAMHQKQALDAVAPGLDEEEFSSLRLQGGDITRPIYRWAEEAEARAHGRGRNQRSKSFHISRPEPGDETLDIGSIKQPGGMRRNYIRRAAHSPSPGRSDGEDLAGMSRRGGHRPRMLTSNFIEFLTLYGHFAGEELEEDDEVLAPDEYFSSDVHEDDLGYGYEGGSEDEREPMEDSALLTPGRRKRKRKDRGGSGQNTSWGATLLLLKSFVGTGVLFLPKAYLNGGMVFSNLVLLFVACLSYYCFVLLVNTRMKVDGSFGDIGGILYGKWMRTAILGSIVLSQIGFVAAYIVFTSENLQAFILAVSDCRTYIDIKWMILMQMAVFLPFSLLRDISKLAITALIADGLILVGLLYLYYYDILTIVRNHGVADIVNFNNNNWQLFIGTAIFTFEGIGLIIPIQESMRRPKDFPWVLGGVMIVITVVFISMGALSYAAYGSKTETVVILNLPQDDKFVNAVQFMYSLAILLSTPLQIFPAIRITETELFTRSGKYNPWIKWQKNIFRFFVVMLCAAIAWGGANDLDKFVSLVGCFACVPLVYIYPPMLHYKAISRTRFRKLADIALAVFGAVVMAYTTSLTIMSWANKSSAPKLPTYCAGRP